MPPKKSTSSSTETRSWTMEQRREKFLELKAKHRGDWRILEEGVDDTFIPYGYLTIDQVLGWRGMVHGGRVVQIHGSEGAGKSTTCAGISANYQKQTGEPVAIFDFEKTINSKYARNLGIDESMAFIKRPDSIDQCSADVLDLMNAGVRLYTFDSIPRMKSKVPEKDIKTGDAYKKSIGKHAKDMQDFFDVMLPYAAEHDCTFLMVNQQRDRIDDSPDAKWATKYPSFTNLPYTLPGGRSVRYVTSSNMELKITKAYKAGGYTDDAFLIEPGKNEGMPVVTQVRARSLKDKVTGAGFREGSIWLRPGRGIDENISIRQMARHYKFIDFVGRTWFVGKNADEAIAKYPNKDAAIQDLVIDQNPGVLGPLRDLLVSVIDANEFSIEVDPTLATYLKGEDTAFDDDEATLEKKGFEVEDLDLSVGKVLGGDDVEAF